MTKKTFSTHWKRSTQPRKQRKYRYNAPLHVQQKLVHVHLSAELRQKHGTRAVQVRQGDKVKVLRGKFKRQEGKVGRVDVKHERVYVTGLEYVKKDGAKVPAAFNPSNIMITVLEMSDKRRKFGKEKSSKAKTKTPEESKQ